MKKIINFKRVHGKQGAICDVCKEFFEDGDYGWLTKTPFWFQLGSSHQNCVGWSQVIDPE